MYIFKCHAVRRWTNVGRAWVTERKGCIIGRHFECDYLHPPSISIPLYSRGSGLRCYGGNGFLPRRAPIYGTPNLLSLVIDDRFSTSLLSANLRFSAPGFDTRVTTGSFSRDRARPHDDRLVRRRSILVLDTSNSFPSGNYRARYADAVALS